MLRRVDVENAGRDLVDECAIVTGQHDRPVPSRHLGAEVLGGRIVEMIGGLVEQQGGGAAQQQCRQSQSRSLTTGDRVHRTIEREMRQPQSGEQLVASGIDAPDPEVLGGVQSGRVTSVVACRSERDGCGLDLSLGSPDVDDGALEHLPERRSG